MAVLSLEMEVLKAPNTLREKNRRLFMDKSGDPCSQLACQNPHLILTHSCLSVGHSQSSQAHPERVRSEWVIVSIPGTLSLCLSLCAPAHGEETRRGLCPHFPKIAVCNTESGSFLGGQHRPYGPPSSPLTMGFPLLHDRITLSLFLFLLLWQNADKSNLRRKGLF